MKVQIGEKLEERGHFSIDLTTLIKTKLLVQANSGGGKSYLIRKFLEQTYEHVQHVVLDIEGEFATLRDHFDYILAGKGADVAATPQTAEFLARKVLELEASIIIDLYELKKHERVLFVQRFLDAMVNAPKELWHPVVIVLDEAHIFAPEKGESQALGAVVDMATRGRKRGFCLIPATQRLAKLHKDVAAECGNKLIGRTGLDIDMKRASEELGFNSKTQMLGLRDLEPGQFFAFGPAISKSVIKVAVGEVITRHLEAGQRLKEKIPVATEKVKTLLAKLDDLPKQAEEERQDRESLRARIRDLERELRAAPKHEIDPKAIERAVADTKKAIAKHVLKLNHSLAQAIGPVVNATIKECMDELQMEQPPSVVRIPDHVIPVEVKSLSIGPIPPYKTIKGIVGPDTPLGRCERAILKFLAARPDAWFNTSQIGAWTGYSKKSSGFQNALSTLNTNDWIQRNQGSIRINPMRINQAISVLGAEYEEPARSPEQWKNKLATCPRKIFECLLDEPRQIFDKAELATRTGYSTSSSGFQNALFELATLGLMRRTNGGVQINPEIIDV